MTRYRRSPRALAGPLEALGRDWAPVTVLAEAQRRWSQAVGPAIAAESTPTAERGGTLTVACSSSLWAHELDLMAPELLARLNEVLGSGSIGRLRCVTADVPF